MALIVVLGLAAVLTRRGRALGAVAIVLDLLQGPSALSLVLRVARLVVPAD